MRTRFVDAAQHTDAFFVIRAISTPFPFASLSMTLRKALLYLSLSAKCKTLRTKMWVGPTLCNQSRKHDFYYKWASMQATLFLLGSLLTLAA